MLTVIERPDEVAKKEGIINVQHANATRRDPSLYKIQSLHHQHLRNCSKRLLTHNILPSFIPSLFRLCCMLAVVVIVYFDHLQLVK